MNGNQQSLKTRNGSADLLKGLAVLFMVQVHVLEQLAIPDLYNSFIGKISLFIGGPACAPVFMAVMGYFLASSNKPLKGLLIRGILLFAGGILLNAGRSANLLIRILSGESDLNPWHFIFGADILPLAGLSVIIIAILRPLFKSNFLLYLILAFTVALLSPILSQYLSFKGSFSYLTAFLWENTGWSYFPMFPWLAYVLAGYAFRLFMKEVKWVKQIKTSEYFYFAIPLWLIILITLPWAFRITSDLTGPGGYYHHGILFFSWTVIFMISYLVIILLIDSAYGQNWLAKGIKWMGCRVTLLYVIQWLIIGNIATVLYRSQDVIRVSGWIPAITLATIILAIICLKIKSAVR